MTAATFKKLKTYLYFLPVECARKFFHKINQHITAEMVKYDVIDSYGRLKDVAEVTRGKVG